MLATEAIFTARSEVMKESSELLVKSKLEDCHRHISCMELTVSAKFHDFFLEISVFQDFLEKDKNP